MRWDLIGSPVDGVDEALAVVDGFDRVLVTGLLRPDAQQVAALHALADAVSVTPLGRRVADAVAKVVAGSVSDDHLAALAAARSALLGAVHDGLLARFDEATGLVRPQWSAAAAGEAAGANLLAASRSWLSDLAVAGWRGIDHDLVTGSQQVVAATWAQPPLRRLAVLLDGFAAELRASSPGATLARVPVRRWADLWSRAMLLSQPGAAATAEVGAVSGRLLPLGVELHEHPTAVQAQIHAVLEPADGSPARLVRASVSAAKVDTIVGRGVWQLLRAHCSLLAALAEHRAVELVDMPATTGGDLLWDDDRARPGTAADPFATARVQLAGATPAPVEPLQRHPVRIAEPILIEGYAATAHDGGVTFTIGGHPFEVDVDRLPAAGPLTAALVASSTACLGLLRWDAGRWTLQPLAVEATVKRKTTAVHGGEWAGPATTPASVKAEAAAGDAVAVLRERAGRLLRA
ncbi:hypothetical protein F4553_000708 [Allocatelliglobosispora scoriae]|uniref:Uncharacterized protein n=1 Tax=Allocatelliglobosispora scoriae TaxID=643052 RepID=A0A841BJI4_9ACTN|nr:hypothetical protein [Allocatelliglobosispora scoriae]MBB5867329.1 hypothetical protein [Allocatelliglobosispora scoriae]